MVDVHDAVLELRDGPVQRVVHGHRTIEVEVTQPAIEGLPIKSGSYRARAHPLFGRRQKLRQPVLPDLPFLRGWKQRIFFQPSETPGQLS